MIKIFYGFVVIGPQGQKTMFNDFILKSAEKSFYDYLGNWKHEGCYWMVLE